MDKAKVSKFFFPLLYLALGICFAAALTILYWVIYDDNFNRPTELYPIEYTFNVPVGGFFKTKYVSFRYRECYSQVERVIKNESTGARFVESVGNKVTIDATSQERIVEVELPNSLEPGLYSYDAKVRYYCNPANNIFGPIILDPIRILFYVVDRDSPEKWIDFNPNESVRAPKPIINSRVISNDIDMGLAEETIQDRSMQTIR